MSRSRWSFKKWTFESGRFWSMKMDGSKIPKLSVNRFLLDRSIFAFCNAHSRPSTSSSFIPSQFPIVAYKDRTIYQTVLSSLSDRQLSDMTIQFQSFDRLVEPLLTVHFDPRPFTFTQGRPLWTWPALLFIYQPLKINPPIFFVIAQRISCIGIPATSAFILSWSRDFMANDAQLSVVGNRKSLLGV